MENGGMIADLGLDVHVTDMDANGYLPTKTQRFGI